MVSGYNIEEELLVYAKLQKYFPLLPGYDHGWAMREYNAINSTKKNLSKYHLVWNKRVANGIVKFLNKKIPIISGCPYKLFKERKDIKNLKNKSTIFFYAHSTKKVLSNQGQDEIINILKNIPKSLSPVDICLHWQDFKNKNLLNFFKKNNFEVYCAGNIYSNKYMKNFYNILSNYNHCISNQLGTYTLLSIDLNIPFSLVNPEPEYTNIGGDINVPNKYKISDFSFGNQARAMFLNKFSINSDQKIFVKNELGFDDKENSNVINNVIVDEFKNCLKKYKIKQIFYYYLKKIYETTQLIN
jgi:hypothetical protein